VYNSSGVNRQQAMGEGGAGTGSEPEETGYTAAAGESEGGDGGEDHRDEL
jgi:hypothetical protein